MATKTKADRSFDEKLSHLLRAGRQKPTQMVMAIDEESAARYRREQERPLELDTAAVAALFTQYGTYLELIGMDEPVGSELTFQYPVPLEVPAEDEQELADA